MQRDILLENVGGTVGIVTLSANEKGGPMHQQFDKTTREYLR